MAIGSFGSGSGITIAGFTATVINQGSYADEFPVADGTPITQTQGHRVMYTGLVKTADPIEVDVLFDATVAIPTKDAIISGEVVNTIHVPGNPASDATQTGTGSITRFAMGELTHDGLQTATITITWAGGATGIVHVSGTV